MADEVAGDDVLGFGVGAVGDGAEVGALAAEDSAGAVLQFLLLPAMRPASRSFWPGFIAGR